MSRRPKKKRSSGGDPWEHPTAKRWVQHVLDEMAPKLKGSRVAMCLIPEHSEGDVKFWVELGAMIMMDKPIIAVVFNDGPVPPKLELVADEIVRCPNGVDPASSEELGQALQRAVERHS